MLFLDTRPLHAVMVQHVVTLEQKIKGEPLSNRTPRRSEQLTLFTKLAAQVDPEFKPFARRGERVTTTRQRRRDRRLPEDRQLLQGRGAPAHSARRYDRRELRQHDGHRRVRPHPQRADAAQRARAPAHRRARGARRTVGSEGRLADRVQAGRADPGGQRGHARHAGRDPSARPAALDARHHPPDEAARPPIAPRSACRSSPTRSPPSTSSSSASAAPTNIRSTAKARRSTAAGSARCCWRCARATASRWCNR